MTIKRKASLGRKMEIDLTGPQGNAYFLLGTADDLYKQFGKSDEERKALQDEMTSGDYENLVAVFDREFGYFIDLLR